MAPSDSNGVYSLPPGYNAVTGDVIQASQHNPPLEDIASSLTQRLMRSGAAPMTGPLKLVDGSASAPAVTINSATGTGFYKTASGGLGLSINGSQVAEFGSGGLSKGGKFIGELFAYIGSNVPPLCVFPVGQTLSRTTYADLWTFAQDEISNSNAFFNNGNGTTTFGIGDMRGRGFAAKDNMGGSDAGRLANAASSIAIVRNTLGGAGGSSTVTLAVSQVPALSFSGMTGNDSPDHVHGYGGDNATGSGGTAFSNGGSSAGIFQTNNTGGASTRHQHDFSGTTTGGGGAHDNMPPTMLTNIAMFAGA